MLKKVQEPKGYYFSDDREHVMRLMNALLKNKERYGYMCCPCRLASEDPEWDRDMICPCAYREADVAEYGTAIAISTFPGNGERARYRIRMCPSAGPPTNFASKEERITRLC